MSLDTSMPSWASRRTSIKRSSRLTLGGAIVNEIDAEDLDFLKPWTDLTRAARCPNRSLLDGIGNFVCNLHAFHGARHIDSAD